MWSPSFFFGGEEGEKHYTEGCGKASCPIHGAHCIILSTGPQPLQGLSAASIKWYSGRMVQFPHAGRRSLCYQSCFDPALIEARLDALLISGPIADADLVGRIDRLGRRFFVYASSYPYGLWAPGLAVSPDMAALTEAYLPFDEIRRAFYRLLTLSMKIDPVFAATPFASSASWLSLLPRLDPSFQMGNPAALLARLCRHPEDRLRFIFSLFLPKHYGASFRRYPGQENLIRRWLATNHQRFSQGITCLDAACGSGEGTYALGLLIQKEVSGVPLDIRGETLEAVELFAAAHACFPHDPVRQEHYRSRVSRMAGGQTKIFFALGDITKPSSDPGRYDLVVCNGILGGPMLQKAEEVKMAVECLTARLRGGGLFVSADRFHGGWKQRFPPKLLGKMLQKAGLQVLEVEDGVAGVKRQ